MRGKGSRALGLRSACGITPAYAGKRYAVRDVPAHVGDHPRLCGEKSHPTTPFSWCTGSPPPMRGKARHIAHRYGDRRITPAYAGKSPSWWAWAAAGRDHPRLCGEKEAAASAVWRQSGSPPPMRGKGFGWLIDHKDEGITPAYAGKRCTPQSYRAIYRDHPRLCGEKRQILTEKRKAAGSPPPMRGKVHIVIHTIAIIRITPAYAGKRCAPVTTMCKHQGSPPPMRGKDPVKLLLDVCTRITPAYAGKSFVVKSNVLAARDHPRLCGEKGFGLFPQPLYLGSPPPMRGKVKIIFSIVTGKGITPAYAGKSAVRFRSDFAEQDHPRLCGEKTKPTPKEAERKGSPPPMRGKGSGLILNQSNTGITPAYAGKRSILLFLRLRPQDHPRLCGEKDGSSGVSTNNIGSPPPMRGKGRSRFVLDCN